MPELRRQMRLYHGSYWEVSAPDLSRCARFKDFGRGFYLTSSEQQARNFSLISTRKAVDSQMILPQKYGVMNVFTCADPSGLRVYQFPSADKDWLHCVVGHRRNRYFLDVVRQMEQYDVICGKIANDNTNVTLTTYVDGIFGEIGSDAADGICISLLLPEWLQDQFCFRTEKALAVLRFDGSERVWM